MKNVIYIDARKNGGTRQVLGVLYGLGFVEGWQQYSSFEETYRNLCKSGEEYDEKNMRFKEPFPIIFPNLQTKKFYSYACHEIPNLEEYQEKTLAECVELFVEEQKKQPVDINIDGNEVVFEKDNIYIDTAKISWKNFDEINVLAEKFRKDNPPEEKKKEKKIMNDVLSFNRREIEQNERWSILARGFSILTNQHGNVTFTYIDDNDPDYLNFKVERSIEEDK